MKAIGATTQNFQEKIDLRRRRNLHSLQFVRKLEEEQDESLDQLQMQRDKIIVALDVPRKESALDLVRQLAGQISFFKIGLQLYTAEGPEIVRAVLGTGAKVFLDLKLHDIPSTVARAVDRRRS